MPSPAELLESLDPQIRAILLETGALLQGHFVLTSGLHSAFYFQAMRLLQHPKYAALAAEAAARHFAKAQVSATFSPAVGGIVWGYAVAERLPECRAIFAERVEGRMTLRRGFEIHPGERILLTEDVTTTGGSVMELKQIAEANGACVVGLAAVLDRSGGAFNPGVESFAWARMKIETWPADALPPDLAALPATKPGSRNLKS